MPKPLSLSSWERHSNSTREDMTQGVLNMILSMESKKAAEVSSTQGGNARPSVLQNADKRYHPGLLSPLSTLGITGQELNSASFLQTMQQLSHNVTLSEPSVPSSLSTTPQSNLTSNPPSTPSMSFGSASSGGSVGSVPYSVASAEGNGAHAKQGNGRRTSFQCDSASNGNGALGGSSPLRKQRLADVLTTVAGDALLGQAGVGEAAPSLHEMMRRLAKDCKTPDGDDRTFSDQRRSTAPSLNEDTSALLLHNLHRSVRRNSDLTAVQPRAGSPATQGGGGIASNLQNLDDMYRSMIRSSGWGGMRESHAHCPAHGHAHGPAHGHAHGHSLAHGHAHDLNHTVQQAPPPAEPAHSSAGNGNSSGNSEVQSVSSTRTSANFRSGSGIGGESEAVALATVSLTSGLVVEFNTAFSAAVGLPDSKLTDLNVLNLFLDHKLPLSPLERESLVMGKCGTLRQKALMVGPLNKCLHAYTTWIPLFASVKHNHPSLCLLILTDAHTI
eukprot:CAMPEP_0177672114 /NCGR_PEP_ID=MMETSP0447-20121125/25130_1 /TAXON_ID=0 /ORGANISM="Stygamoeba regulata, Strain BSH-02190019" /LENGTH=499 /DNA_ID=CAMNT_0019179683 /DNA_START=510 /DNA_END=2009 /DNA_ORIENTATION=-